LHNINAWHLTSKKVSVELLGKLWDCAKELQLETAEMRNVLLLSEDRFRQTAWHMAAEEGNVEVLKKLRDWVK